MTKTFRGIALRRKGTVSLKRPAADGESRKQNSLLYPEKMINCPEKTRRSIMWSIVNEWLKVIDDFVWGVPLMVLILAGGLLLTILVLHHFLKGNRNLENLILKIPVLDSFFDINLYLILIT